MNCRKVLSFASVSLFSFTPFCWSGGSINEAVQAAVNPTIPVNIAIEKVTHTIDAVIPISGFNIKFSIPVGVELEKKGQQTTKILLKTLVHPLQECILQESGKYDCKVVQPVKLISPLPVSSPFSLSLKSLVKGSLIVVSVGAALAIGYWVFKKFMVRNTMHGIHVHALPPRPVAHSSAMFTELSEDKE